MEKMTKNFYKEINILLKRENAILSIEFEKRIKIDDPKEIFMWLDSELKNKSLSSELDELLTDFFYSIH